MNPRRTAEAEWEPELLAAHDSIKGPMAKHPTTAGNVAKYRTALLEGTEMRMANPIAENSESPTTKTPRDLNLSEK